MYMQFFAVLIFSSQGRCNMPIKLKFLIILLLLFLIILGAELIYRSGRSVWADAPSVNSEVSIEEVVPLSQLQKVAKKENIPQPNQEKVIAADHAVQKPVSNSLNLSRSSRLAENVPLPHPAIEQFKGLYVPWATQFLRSGWLHTIRHTEHPDKESPMATLSNGVQVPTAYIQEDWILTEGDGKAIEGVFLMRDLTGKIIQVSVYRDLTWHNLTVGDEISVKKAPDFKPDFGFLSNMTTVYELGGRIIQSEASLDGQMVLVFTYEETHDPPLLLNDFSQAVKQFRGRAYVDPESGAFLSLERIFVPASGKEYIVTRTKRLTVEFAESPPEEILAYLEEIK